MQKHMYDVVIVGAGGAGMRAALESSARVSTAVLTKLHPTRSGTGTARGGIAGALGTVEDDNWQWHAFDTIKAGDYLVDQDAAELMCREAMNAVLELEVMGLPFDRTPSGRIDQRSFGGHTRNNGEASVRRSSFAADRTGQAMLQTLYQNCVKQGVQFYDEFYVLDLLLTADGVAGVVAYELATGELHVFNAKSVVLATGGFGKVFKTTSNAHSCTGDGMALAWRAGLPLEDMEFFQFHPTGLAGLGIVLSEAARGAGAILRNGDGEPFMQRYAPSLRDLAAGDVVARAIAHEVREGRGAGPDRDHVLLDLTHLPAAVIDAVLPDTTFLSVDPAAEAIAVNPTAHYAMGGVPTTLSAEVLANNADVVPGLYAAGEVACVSVHGSNRLPTNSLLEVTVFGKRAGIAAASYCTGVEMPEAATGVEAPTVAMLNRLLSGVGSEKVATIRADLQNTMDRNAQVYRSEASLAGAEADIALLRKRFLDIAITDKGTRYNSELVEAVELGFLLDLAEVLVASARNRAESRGGHARVDFPERDDANYLNHTMAYREPDGTIRLDVKPVVITRYQPSP
jgi:succinate dehydrogenase / fumarate reductase flavoprotein subunit